MDKEYPTTDYAAILADMEAKKTALENAIAGLRGALASGALGVAVGDSLLFKDSVAVSLSPVAATASAGSIALPRGAFLGKTATESIKLYLSTVRKKQTNKEIAQALKDGGLESTRKNFDNLVTNALFRLKQDGTVLRFDDGWGLAEWYPESFRARVTEKAANSGKRNAKKKAVARRADDSHSKKTSGSPTAGGLEQRIEAILRSDPSRVFTAQGIADALGVNAGAVSLALGRMAGKRKAEKAQAGYRAFSGNVQEMPETGKVS